MSSRVEHPLCPYWTVTSSLQAGPNTHPWPAAQDRSYPGVEGRVVMVGRFASVRADSFAAAEAVPPGPGPVASGCSGPAHPDPAPTSTIDSHAPRLVPRMPLRGLRVGALLTADRVFAMAVTFGSVRGWRGRRLGSGEQQREQGADQDRRPERDVRVPIPAAHE